MSPLVSVITPTWGRHKFLLGRCIPSVQAQAYPAITHIVISDGPDPELRARIPPGIVYDELPEHDLAVRWGVRARLRALELARGEYIAYLDDDDAWHPDHVAVLARALDEHPEAGFGWAQARVHHRGEVMHLGDAEPRYGCIAMSMIFHRRQLAAPWQDAPMPDAEMVENWLAAGTAWVAAGEETVDYYRERPVEKPAAVLTRAGYQATQF